MSRHPCVQRDSATFGRREDPGERTADAIRPTSGQAVGELYRLGVQVAMLTGDNRGTAQRIASELGIETVLAEVLPGQKADLVAVNALLLKWTRLPGLRRTAPGNGGAAPSPSQRAHAAHGPPN